MNDQIGETWEPICVALASRVTAGDDKFVTLVRAEHEREVRACQDRAERDPRADDVPDIDRLGVLAGFLANEMAGGAELTKPGAADAPHTCVRRSLEAQPAIALLFTNDSGWLRQLTADFEASCQHQMKDLGADKEMHSKLAKEGPPDWLRAYDNRCPKVFKHSVLRTYLEGRFKAALKEICKGIRDGRIRARGTPKDGSVDGPAGDMPPSAINDYMTIDIHGLLHQGTRAWKSVTVCWQDFIGRCTVPPLPENIAANAPISGQCTSQIEAIQRAFQVVFKGGVPPGVSVKERNSRLGDHIVKVGGGRPSTRTFQRALPSKRRARTKRS